jgi:hypothetical protein
MTRRNQHGSISGSTITPATASSVVERPTSRAVCRAFLAALARFGVPEQVLTDIQTRCALMMFVPVGRGVRITGPAPTCRRCLTERSVRPAGPAPTRLAAPMSGPVDIRRRTVNATGCVSVARPPGRRRR